VAGARAADWAIQQVEVGPGYRGALAIEGPAAAIRLRDQPLDVGTRALGGREEYLLRRVCAQGELRQETPR
jgi:hypothetical protein